MVEAGTEDLKPEEREAAHVGSYGLRLAIPILPCEVMGAFVVFWCQRTRDAVLGQYGWSRCRLSRGFAQLQLTHRFQTTAGTHSCNCGYLERFLHVQQTILSYPVVVFVSARHIKDEVIPPAALTCGVERCFPTAQAVTSVPTRIPKRGEEMRGRNLLQARGAVVPVANDGACVRT